MKKKSLLKDDSFPDLNKDGEVTYADVLEGRGAFAVGHRQHGLQVTEA